MGMSFEVHVIRNARDAINHADAERRKQGISQMKITELADFSDVGQTYARLWKSGDGRVSRFIKVEDVLGFELVAVPKEHMALFMQFMDTVKGFMNAKGDGNNGRTER